MAGAREASTSISIYDNMSINYERKICVIRTFIGLPSTRRPFIAVSALLAPSARLKVMFAMPRLTPLGPYDISTFLIGPTDLPKYS